MAAQTAYGIEAEVEGYPEAYNSELMLFMDFRRHHSGIWESTAKRLKVRSRQTCAAAVCQARERCLEGCASCSTSVT